MFLFYVSLLKIKNVGNSSNAFAVILPQQRPVLFSAHAQNFFSWSCREMQIAQTVIGVTKVANERYLPYLPFLLWISCIEGVKVAQS